MMQFIADIYLIVIDAFVLMVMYQKWCSASCLLWCWRIGITRWRFPFWRTVCISKYIGEWCSEIHYQAIWYSVETTLRGISLEKFCSDITEVFSVILSASSRAQHRHGRWRWRLSTWIFWRKAFRSGCSFQEFGEANNSRGYIFIFFV